MSNIFKDAAQSFADSNMNAYESDLIREKEERLRDGVQVSSASDAERELMAGRVIYFQSGGTHEAAMNSHNQVIVDDNDQYSTVESFLREFF